MGGRADKSERKEEMADGRCAGGGERARMPHFGDIRDTTGARDIGDTPGTLAQDMVSSSYPQRARCRMQRCTHHDHSSKNGVRGHRHIHLDNRGPGIHESDGKAVANDGVQVERNEKGDGCHVPLEYAGGCLGPAVACGHRQRMGRGIESVAVTTSRTHRASEPVRIRNESPRARDNLKQ